MLKRIVDILKQLSIGKYRTPLYFRGYDNYATVFSTLLTLVCFSILLVYAIYEFSGIIKREHYNFDISGEAIEYSSIDNFYKFH